jgi:hypothetical protein
MAKKKSKGSSESKGPELNGKPLSASVDDLVEYLEAGGEGIELIHSLFADFQERLDKSIHPRLLTLQGYRERIESVLDYVGETENVSKLREVYQDLLTRYMIEEVVT